MTRQRCAICGREHAPGGHISQRDFIVCKHGHSKRQCSICESDDLIAELKALLKEASEWICRCEGPACYGDEPYEWRADPKKDLRTRIAEALK